MSTLKPALIALSLMLVAPMAVQAAEITLVPAVKLQIGDRDNNGHYWDGGVLSTSHGRASGRHPSSARYYPDRQFAVLPRARG